jgi:hypothetical protein
VNGCHSSHWWLYKDDSNENNKKLSLNTLVMEVGYSKRETQVLKTRGNLINNSCKLIKNIYL